MYRLNEILTLDNIANTFYKFEKELNLLDIQIQKVYFWKIMRFSIFMKIANYYGLYEQAHLSLNYTSMQRKISNLKKIYNTEVNSYISRKRAVDILIFEHPRKVKIGSKYIDIYTNSKVEEIKQSNFSYEVVDSPYLDKHYDKPNKFRSYSEDFGFKYKKYRKKYIFNLANEEKNVIYNIENRFFELFKINIKLENQILSTIRGFSLRKKIIKEALEKRRVKKVYLVVSYGHEVLIAACKELGIETIEIQHGTMSYYHPGYSFPYNTTVPYFPDKIEMLGEYWEDSTPIPLAKEKCIVMGYPYLQKQISKYKDIQKIRNQILFLSQGTIGKNLSLYAYKFAIANPSYNIIFKLHPGEFGRWRSQYPELIKSSELKNFKIIENEENLYKTLASSSYVFGVYSTAIYEALESACKVFLVELNGIEDNKYLIENNFVIKVDFNNYDIKKLLQREMKPYPKGYFFNHKVIN